MGAGKIISSSFNVATPFTMPVCYFLGCFLHLFFFYHITNPLLLAELGFIILL